MAVRSPSNYTQWHNLEAIGGDKPFRAALIDNIIDDMEFFLTSPQLIYADVFKPIQWFAGLSISRVIQLNNKDDCLFTGSQDQQVAASVFAWASDGTTSGSATLAFRNAAAGQNTMTFTLTADAQLSASGGWQTFQTANFVAKDTAETGANRPGDVEVSIGTSGGSGSIALGGIIIVAT